MCIMFRELAKLLQGAIKKRLLESGHGCIYYKFYAVFNRHGVPNKLLRNDCTFSEIQNFLHNTKQKS